MATRSAITLVEGIIYLALLAVMLTVVAQFALTVGENNRTGIERNKVEKSAIFINQHLNNLFELSNSINTAGSQLNSDNGVLVLGLILGGSSTYSIIDGQLNINRGGADYLISPPDLNISAFRIESVMNNSNEIIGARTTVTINSDSQNSASRSITTYYRLNIN